MSAFSHLRALEIRRGLNEIEPAWLDFAEEFAFVLCLPGLINAQREREVKAETQNLRMPFEEAGRLTLRAADVLEWARRGWNTVCWSVSATRSAANANKTSKMMRMATPKVRRILLLTLGWEELPKTVSVYGAPAHLRMREPVPGVLLQTDGGWVLLDTGFNTALIRDPALYRRFYPTVEYKPVLPGRGEPIEEALHGMGIDIDDIHAGGSVICTVTMLAG